MKQMMENEVKNLQDDEKDLRRKTTALFILYKKRCLIDKWRSDAIKRCLIYEIERAKIEGRTHYVNKLEKESVIQLI